MSFSLALSSDVRGPAAAVAGGAGVGGWVEALEGAGAIEEGADTAASAPSGHEPVEGTLQEEVSRLALPQPRETLGPILGGVN